MADEVSTGTAINEYVQILIIYQYIKDNFRRNFSIFSETISKTDFIKSLKMIKVI